MEAVRGLLIVFEGLDGVGKTTQSQMLLEALKSVAKIEPVLMRFPDRTTATGKLLDAHLKQASNLTPATSHLLFAANRWEARDQILAHLKEGRAVLLDRYSFSGVAYSVAQGVSKSWCVGTEVGLPAPDILLFLDGARSFERKAEERERFDKEDIRARIGEAFTRMQTSEWVVIKAAGSKEEIHTRICKAVPGTLTREPIKIVQPSLFNL